MTNDYYDHTETDSTPDVCRSCGKLIVEHGSLGRTCKELQEAGLKIAEYRQALTRLALYASGARRENTQAWMVGLVEHLNKTAVTIGEMRRFDLHRANPSDMMWIEMQSKEPS